MRRCALVLATALLSVTALSGCGSADDEAADASDTTSSPTEDSSESPDTDETPDEDKSDDKSDSDKSDKKDSDKSGGSDDTDDDAEKKSDGSDDAKQAKADYCGMVKSLKADFDPSNSASLAASRDLDAIADRLDQITGEAPAKLRPSWQRLTRTFEILSDQLAKYDIDLTDPEAFGKLKPKEKKALSKVLQKYQSPQLAKATQTIETDVKRRCHIKMG